MASGGGFGASSLRVSTRDGDGRRSPNPSPNAGTNIEAEREARRRIGGGHSTFTRATGMMMSGVPKRRGDDYGGTIEPVLRYVALLQHLCAPMQAISAPAAA